MGKLYEIDRETGQVSDVTPKRIDLKRALAPSQAQRQQLRQEQLLRGFSGADADLDRLLYHPFVSRR